jgi:hypothetical protein
MNDSAKKIIILIISVLLYSCGAGTHGKIKEYKFQCRNAEIVNIVDSFLISNPKYFDSFDMDYGWLYIKIPSTGERFGFEIGGDSEIVLINASKNSENLKIDSDLGYFEEKQLVESFEKNFIEKLKKNMTPKLKLIKNPFILSSNLNIDSLTWPVNVVEIDTFLAYPLPKEIDSTKIDFFKDLVLSFAKQTNQKAELIQYYNLFIVNEEYSGFIGDSIYVTAFYRVIGKNKTYNSIFNQQEWSDYILEKNKKIRLENYRNIRTERVKEGYAETDVFSKYSEEVWMLNNSNLKKKNVR